MVIVDEAYAEFARPGTPSAVTLLPGRERLVVTRTMSKAFALAGARLGYLAADPAVTDALRLVRLPYHLSSLTQAAARAALWYSDVVLDTVQDVISPAGPDRGRAARPRPDPGTQRRQLRPVRRPAATRAATLRSLLAHGVLVRDVGIAGHLRVTAGTEEETGAFLTALGLRDQGGRMTARTARIERVTKESKVLVELDLDGTGRAQVSTGVGFYDHMLTAWPSTR